MTIGVGRRVYTAFLYEKSPKMSSRLCRNPKTNAVSRASARRSVRFGISPMFLRASASATNRCWISRGIGSLPDVVRIVCMNVGGISCMT